MYDNPNHLSVRRSGPASRLRRAGPAVAGLLASVLLVAACGGGATGPGVAGAGSSRTPKASSGSTKKSGLAYSKCMRSHGVPDFPDPNSQGQIQLNVNGPGSDLAPDAPQFKKAQQACKSLEPVGTPAEQRKNYEQALRFAKCMRAHGVPLADPKPPGSGPQTGSHSGSGQSNGDSQGVDPNSPQFQKAQQACRSLQPSGPGFSTNQSGGGS
jgi:hypothetical protein